MLEERGEIGVQPMYIIREMSNSVAIMETSVGVPQDIKNRITAGHTEYGEELQEFPRDLHRHVHSCIIHSK